MNPDTLNISVCSRYLSGVVQRRNIVLRRCLVLFMFLFSVFTATQAQLSFQLSDDHIDLKDKTLGSITVRVTNPGQSVQKAMLKTIADKQLELITQALIPIQLGAGDSIFIPVKIFNRAGLSAGDHKMHILLLHNDNVLQSQICTVSEPRKRSAVLYCLAPTIQLLGNEDSITIQVKVANTGNVPASLSIVANLPSEMQSQVFHKPVHLRLSVRATKRSV